MEPNRISSLNIVFVDDDSDELYLFNEALEHSGLPIIVHNANHGNQLSDYLKNNEMPDLIFLDINMPYKDGPEVLKEIRSNPLFDKLRIVIYSTTKKANVVATCYKSGADLFVVKPENFEGMVKMINEICTKDWTNFQRPPLDNGFVITPE